MKILILFGILLVFSFHAASAQTDINVKISEQKITISNMEKIAEQKRLDLVTAESNMGKSWEALLQYDTYRTDYEAALASLQEAKDTLQLLIKERSKLILEEKLRKSEMIKAERAALEAKYKTFDTTSITKLVGVQLSQSCIIMIKNNIPNDCPTYEQLSQLDTSLESSGKFGYADGFYSRQKTPYHNPWRLYDFDDTPRIIVDPPAGMAERIRLVTIHPSFTVYFLASDMKISDSIRTWHEGRYIDNCYDAHIGTKNLPYVLSDTIYTLHNNCTHTTLKELQQETMPYTDLPIWETSSWKYKVWLEETKQKCKEVCKEY